MTDSLDAKNALHTALLAKTRPGRVFKLVVFWLSVIGMFVVPLGVLVIYFLWRHGNAITADASPGATIASPIEGAKPT